MQYQNDDMNIMTPCHMMNYISDVITFMSVYNIYVIICMSLILINIIMINYIEPIISY